MEHMKEPVGLGLNGEAVVRKKMHVTKYDEGGIMIGYVLDEGSAWTLIGVGSEAEVESLIKEFKATGSITLSLPWLGVMTETISPVAVAKFVSTDVYMKHYTYEQGEE